MKTPLPLRRGVFPLCFSSAAQYRIWKASAQRVKPGDSKYCADCTSEYQSDMILQRRCAYPGTTFHTAAGGFLGGGRPGCRLPNRKKEVA